MLGAKEKIINGGSTSQNNFGLKSPIFYGQAPVLQLIESGEPIALIRDGVPFITKHANKGVLASLKQYWGGLGFSPEIT